jgi:hypothetical protein
MQQVELGSNGRIKYSRPVKREEKVFRRMGKSLNLSAHANAATPSVATAAPAGARRDSAGTKPTGSLPVPPNGMLLV